MIEEQDNIEEIKGELEDSYSNDDLYNINSWGADLSFRELISMYKENELLKPELQIYRQAGQLSQWRQWCYRIFSPSLQTVNLMRS